MKPYFLWIICLGWLLMLPLHGQAADLTEGRETGRRAWIVAAETPEGLANPLTVLSGENLHEVQLHPRDVGAPIPVDETGVVRVVSAETGPDGKVAHKNLAVAQFAEGVREALIVLVPNDKDEGLAFNSKVIDLSKFKAGGCLYINLVKTKIGITIGDYKTVVKPGGMEFINPLNGKKSDVLPIRFFYEVPKKSDAEWKLMTASKFAVYESRREICIFFYNKEIENVDFRGIPFITPKPRPKP